MIYEVKIRIIKCYLSHCHMSVRVAERSKAPDSRSGPRMWAWVRIPFLTFFLSIMYILCVAMCMVHKGGHGFKSHSLLL